MSFVGFNSFQKLAASKRRKPAGGGGGRVGGGVLPSSPLLYYPFTADIKNYATGSGVVDATTTGTTPPTITAFSCGYVANTLYCSSSSGGSIVLPNVNISSTVGFTVSFWLYLPATVSGGFGWCAYASSIGNRSLLYVYSNNTTRFQLYNEGTASDNTNNGTNSYWNFYAIVQPANNGAATGYWNATTFTNANWRTNAATTSQHYIFGDNNGAGTGGIPGAHMSNFVFYQRALTPTEIAALYAN